MRWRAGLALAVVVAVAAGIALLAGGDGDAAPGPRDGVAIDIVIDEPPANELRDVDAAADLGADAVRVALQWSGFEPLRKGGYAAWYQDRLDALVARADERGLHVLLTPVYTPCWAARRVPEIPQPCAAATLAASARLPPARMSDYADFAAHLAARYERSLAGIEVWNEPNMPTVWSTPDAAGDYVALVRATYAAVKRAAPDVRVVAGALAGADARFLRALYERGIGGSYDVLSLHPYNDGRAPDALLEDRFAAATFLQGLRAVRAVLRSRRERRPIWLTELGWNTSTQRGGPSGDGVSERDQARFLSRALAMLRTPAAGIDFASAAFVYRLRDHRRDPADPQQNYGLLRADRTRKPAFAAVRAAFAMPARAPRLP